MAACITAAKSAGSAGGSGGLCTRRSTERRCLRLASAPLPGVRSGGLVASLGLGLVGRLGVGDAGVAGRDRLERRPSDNGTRLRGEPTRLRGEPTGVAAVETARPEPLVGTAGAAGRQWERRDGQAGAKGAGTAHTHSGAREVGARRPCARASPWPYPRCVPILAEFQRTPKCLQALHSRA